MIEQPTDLDLITDHSFEPSGWPWPELCGYQDAGSYWQCGYTKAEHGDPEPTP